MRAQKESTKHEIENLSASLFASILQGDGEQCPHCDSFLSLDDTLENRTGFNWCPVCRELVRKL
jgi:formamidopyrimidine-DNA glycosylase